jgi:hypothetical protein
MKLTSIEEEAEVMKPISTTRLPNIVIVASIALAFILSDVAQSIAQCGGYCEARQTLTICHRAVTTNDLESHERDAEFEKCRSDPVSYRAPPTNGGAQFGQD